ncbi:MAG: HDIG domain-containing metalloprotein [bacterium]
MFAAYTQADAEFARKYLKIEEWALFNQLPNFEKIHSVVVARKMLDAIHGQPQYDERKIVRLGLLHDIGKVAEHNSIITKSILVAIRFVAPWLYNWLADRGENMRVLRRFWIHKHHGAVGAKMLERIGESAEILMIIAKHDPRVEEWGPELPFELKLLQEMDSTL